MNAVSVLVVVLLILLNALYVAAEFAAVGARRGQIRDRAQKGSGFAARLLPILEDTNQLDRYIAACQIGITFSSLVLGAYGQATIGLDLGDRLQTLGWDAVAAHSTSATVVLASLTILQVVFGELVPKSLALQFPVSAAVFTFLPMSWSLTLFKPFLTVLNGSGLFIVKLFGAPAGSHRHVHSPQEIDMLLAESADGGLLEPEEQRRLHGAIRLSGRVAREIMTPRSNIRMINGDSEFSEIIEVAMTAPHTRLPVYCGDPDHVVGFLHTRDLAAHLAESRSASVETVLRPILSVPEDTPIHRLIPQLRRRGQRIALVIGDFGSISGVVSLQDVLDALIGLPTDSAELPGKKPPERLPDGRLRLPGLLSISDANRWLGAALHDRQVTTIGGLLLSRFGHLPKPGERATIDGIDLEVERVDRQMIASILATSGSATDSTGKDNP